MQKAIRHRNNIPLYYDKSSEEFRQDAYERYDPMVIKQSMIHLCDALWDGYSMQKVKDFMVRNWPKQNPENILEIGCGVGRLIGDIAMENPASICWGIDYSYQMLKRAKEVWLDNGEVEIDLSRFGFGEDHKIRSNRLSNLNFGLAKCELLPFEDGSQDLVYTSFLLDRLSDPIQGLKEMKRVLRSDGKLIVVSPLNFNTSENWDRFYPTIKLRKEMENIGLEILDWKDEVVIEEPLDRRGNVINWKCLAAVMK